MWGGDGLTQDLRRLRELLQEDLRKELQAQEGRLRDLMKAPRPPGKEKPGTPAIDDFPEGWRRMPTDRQENWAVDSKVLDQVPRVMSVTPDGLNGSVLGDQEPPGCIPAALPHSDSGLHKAPGPKNPRETRRMSVRNKGAPVGLKEDEETRDIRMKAGVFGAGDHKETKLDEDLYDVRNFYKTSGCMQATARSERFEKLTLLVISLNAIYIGVDADNNPAATMLDATWPYQVFDNLFCFYFTTELVIRFGAFESKWNCLKDRWFIFDTLLVMLMIAETWILTLVVLSIGGVQGTMPTGPLRLLRLLRLSRLVRLLREMPELLTLINGMRVAARAVSSALLLVILLNYVFAIVLLMFLADIPEVTDHFGTLGLCMWTLALDGTFMDGTKDILQELRILDTQGYSWLLGWGMISVFTLYVLLTNVTVMNMLIGILCEVVSEVKREDEEGVAIDFMKEHLRTMLTEIDKDNNENISKTELQAVVDDERAQKVLSELQVKPEDVIDLTASWVVGVLSLFHAGKTPFGDPIRIGFRWI
ncbi:unnamed protein product [Effrenium voratum]|uniref:EF-hand domain-containing protein n=1 Tax=Effrenium voratum TaxID=2562239 RepID=A0AA36NBL2_9DINO|nr:unnamed protein product [Effrenium voratum]